MKDNSIKELVVRRLLNLITIKSIISLALLFVFCYLTFNRYDVPNQLESTFGYVIAFFLGTQSSKTSLKGDNNNE